MRYNHRNLDLFAAAGTADQITNEPAKTIVDAIVDEAGEATANHQQIKVANRQNSIARIQVAPRLTDAFPAIKPIKQLWLTVYFQNWPLDALLLQSSDKNLVSENKSHPLVVVDHDEARQIVCACNALAMSSGIHVGMTLHAAFTLVENLRITNRDPRREASTLEKMGAWAMSYTPHICIENAGALLLEVKGSLRLFGGTRAFYSIISNALKTLGIAAKISITPTATSALWLARAQQMSNGACIVSNHEKLRTKLAALPLRFLQWPMPVMQLLSAMGVNTVGDCLRLPRDGLTRRVGAELVRELDQALGVSAQVRRRFVRNERFALHHAFEAEVVALAQCEHCLDSLLDHLEKFLRLRQAAVQAIKITFKTRESDIKIIIRFAGLAWTRQHMQAVCKERFCRIVLPAPVLRLSLLSSAPMRLTEYIQNADLLSKNTAHSLLHKQYLIDRLRARLGHAAVYELSSVADHRPEFASRRCEPATELQTTQPKSHITALTNARPLWLLPTPQLLDVVNKQPRYGGAMHIESGPERIESGWWDERNVARDYYVARALTGQRLWIYRERKLPQQWFLHGIFG